MEHTQKNGARRESSARRVGPNGEPNAKHSNGNGLPKQADSGLVARHWLEIGIRPVPIFRRSKKPKGGKGWNKFRADAETIDQFFFRKDNVGGLWGAPSGWIVDIDLDTEESQLAATILLPETFIYGRKSAPASHYLFVCEGAETKKWQTVDVGTLVEIRSTGSQSVLPPSIHPEGETYEIYHDTEFRKLSRSRLELLCAHLAAASLAAYFWPEEGSRHDYLLAVSGTLLWNGWPDEEVEKFMEAILVAVRSKGNSLEKHRRTVKNACKNFREGNKIPGLPTLSQWLMGDNLKILKNWLGASRRGEWIPETSDLPSEIKEQRELDSLGKEIDPELLEIPGLVGELSKWVSGWSHSPQPLFSTAAALTSVALASRNLYLVDCWDTPLQPYFLMIAPTARGKDAAKNAISFVARKLEIHESIFEGIQSYHALMDKLAKPPNTALWVMDEAARQIKTASRSRGGTHYEVITYLLKLYGQAATYMPGIPGRKNPIPPIDRPFLSVIGLSQPAPLLDALTEEDVQIGMVNRFILLDAGDKIPPQNLNRERVFPSSLQEKLEVFSKIERPKRETPFIFIRFENALAVNRFRAFLDSCMTRITENENSEVWGRANQNALICAGLVAVGINPHKPVITEEIAKWAIQFIQWSYERWQLRIEQTYSRTVTERNSKWIEGIILHARKFEKRTRSHHERMCILRGLMPYTVLLRIARNLKRKDLEDTLESLILGDLVARGEVEGRDCLWTKQDD